MDQPEEYRILTVDGQLVIAGRDRVEAGRQMESGTAHAVYTFLRKYLGVRWLWPGELGEDVIRRDTIKVGPIDDRYHPQLRQRRLRVPYERRLRRAAESGKLDFSKAERLAVERKQRMAERWLRMQHMDHSISESQGSFNMRAGHAFLHWWDRYGESHPEYFALQPDGTRGTFPEKPKWKKLCVAEPGVHQQWLDNTERRLRDDPSLRVVSASPNDVASWGVCTDAKCEAWDHPDGELVSLRWDGRRKQHVALTDRYVTFWNHLARGLRERFPDREVMIGAWAYGVYAIPPVEAELEPEIAIGFVDGTPGSYGGMFAFPPEARERDRRMWKEWADKASKLVWRPNLFHTPAGRLGFPQLELDRMAEDLRFMADHNIIGIDVDSLMDHWGTQGPAIYLLSRLVWNPEADAEAVMADYYNRGFGPAAEAMRAYYEYLEEVRYAFLDDVGGMKQKERYPYFLEHYDDATLDAAEARLEKAEAAVADANGGKAETYRDRVAFVRRGFAFLRASMDVAGANEALREERTVGNLQRAVEAREAIDALLEEASHSFAFSALHYRLYRTGNDYFGEAAQPGLVKALKADPERLLALDDWTFRKDPRGEGWHKGWYGVSAGGEGWRPLAVPAHWKDTRVGDYLGYGWYRATFRVPEARAGEDLVLSFEGVDEQAWVFVNGQWAGEHTTAAVERPDVGIGDLWDEPFTVRIPADRLRPGEENVLAVAVHASHSTGGIWAPVDAYFPADNED